MKLNAKEIVYIYHTMLQNGVVLYGAGQNGLLAVEVLDREGITVKAVADRERKICGKFYTISLQELCDKYGEEVCMITPDRDMEEIRMSLENVFPVVTDHTIVKWLAYFLPPESKNIDYVEAFPFNHYESPYAQDAELKIYRKAFKNKDCLIGINLNEEFQKTLLPKIREYGGEYMNHIQNGKFRFQSENGWFPDSDAAVFHTMIRLYKPKKIIEIGSGYSTSVILDTNEYWMEEKIEIISIEPNPQRLLLLLKEKDQTVLTIKEDYVQNIPLEEYESLDEGDILFIDSSHVARTGGDVPWEYFRILPKLKSGVVIHIHDIFYPFEYPEEWILKGRAYDEAFILRALLMNTNTYEILFFNHMMAQKCEDMYEDLGMKHLMGGGSIWLRKK